MQPSNQPNPDYQFILNNSQPQKKSPLFNLPKPVLLGGVGLIVIMLIVILYAVFSGGSSGNAAPIIDLVGKSKEINRISTAQQPTLKDPNIAALAATVAASTASDNAQLSKYLTSHKVKLDPKKLDLYATNDKAIDDQLAAAATNNSLDSAYISYLRTALNNYSTAIKNAYPATSTQTGKTLLKSSFTSTQTLLASPLLKS